MIKIELKNLIIGALALCAISYYLGIHSSFSDKLVNFYTQEEQSQEEQEASGYKLLECSGDADCFQKNGF